MNAKNTPPRAAKARLHASFLTLAVSSALLLGASFLPHGNAQAMEEGPNAECSVAASGTAASGTAVSGTAVSGANTPFEMPVPKVGSSISSAADMGALAEDLGEKARERDRCAKMDLFLSNALAKLGTPYVYGGTTPSGFDCSGFTGFCAKETFGVELPRTAAGQSALGAEVPLNALEKGDFLFWGSKSGVYHVGIYIGDGNYIHAGNRSRSICIQSMGEYAPSFAKRIF